VAIVTGAARGIGAATAALFARAGALVALVDQDGGALDDVAARIEKEGGQALPVEADVTEVRAVQRMVEAVIEEWRAVDILVNNAGVVRDATLVRVTDEDFDLTLAVNLRGPMLCARAVVPHMIAARRGRILSATSVVALTGNYGQTAYSAAKAGLIGMTRTWARELGHHGITANAVAPGFIDTDMVKDVPDKVVAAFVERTIPKRLGTVDEVAAVYLFLASDQASFVNGAVVGVDGGLRL
jgi:3-oxoacyl-[acyl-carrier protein] reductase